MKYKLILPVLVSITVALGGCKKDSGGEGEPDSFIRFKADGKQQVFEALSQSQLNYSAASGLHLCMMLGSQEASVSNRNVMTITINGNEQVQQGVAYDLVTPLVLKNGTTTTKGSIVYVDASGAGYVAQGPQRISATAEMAARVTITELAGKYMKGSFSAVAYHSTDLSKKVVITDGEFHLKRVD